MIADTLIVIIFCIATLVQEPVTVTSEKADFVQLFKEADKEFDKVHKIDLEALRLRRKKPLKKRLKRQRK